MERKTIKLVHNQKYVPKKCVFVFILIFPGKIVRVSSITNTKIHGFKIKQVYADY